MRLGVLRHPNLRFFGGYDTTTWGNTMRHQPASVGGGTYFLTVNLAEWKRTLLVEHIDPLRATASMVKATHRLHMNAMDQGCTDRVGIRRCSSTGRLMTLPAFQIKGANRGNLCAATVFVIGG